MFEGTRLLAKHLGENTLSDATFALVTEAVWSATYLTEARLLPALIVAVTALLARGVEPFEAIGRARRYIGAAPALAREPARVLLGR